MKANYFTILWWFLLYIDMNQPRVYMCPPIPNPLPPPSPSHPFWLSQWTSFEWPASYIDLGLVIYFTYGKICVSMLFSKIIPPSPSPTESKSLFFYLCLFYCLSHRVIVAIFLISIYIICINILYWCFSFSLTLHCVIGSSFIHLVRIHSNEFF